MKVTPAIPLRPLTIITSCLTLLLVVCTTVWTQETTKANHRIKEFQRQRLAVLEEIRDTAKKLYGNARVPFEDVLAAERAFLDARLAYAETRQDRIDVCDEAVQNATDWQQTIQGRVQSARASRIEELKAQASLLDLKIMRELLEAGE